MNGYKFDDEFVTELRLFFENEEEESSLIT